MIIHELEREVPKELLMTGIHNKDHDIQTLIRAEHQMLETLISAQSLALLSADELPENAVVLNLNDPYVLMSKESLRPPPPTYEESFRN